MAILLHPITGVAVAAFIGGVAGVLILPATLFGLPTALVALFGAVGSVLAAVRYL